MHPSYSPQSINKTCVFSYFCELRVQASFSVLFQPQLLAMFAQDACAGNTAFPETQGFLRCLLFLYLDIYRLPPEVLMGLIPGGLILPQYWDFSQSWYWEGWSRMSPVAARLLLTRAIWVDGRITACRPCGLGAEAGVQQLRVMKKLNWVVGIKARKGPNN